MEYAAVPGQVAHFAINADDVDRGRAFYEAVFGWKFNAWGPPGFYMIDTVGAEVAPAPLLGSFQGRREIIPGVDVKGFECTIAVADIDATIQAIENAGGKVVMPKCILPGIGHLCFFQDTEGNVAGAMQYDARSE